MFKDPVMVAYVVGGILLIGFIAKNATNRN